MEETRMNGRQRLRALEDRAQAWMVRRYGVDPICDLPDDGVARALLQGSLALAAPPSDMMAFPSGEKLAEDRTIGHIPI